MNKQPQRETANHTIVNMIWSDAPTGHSSWFSLVSSLQPGLLLRGPKLHLGMTTLRSLEDPTRRPPSARDPILEDLVNFRPVVEFSLDEALFARTLWSARRGAAGGPSGMTHDTSVLSWTIQETCNISISWESVLPALKCRSRLWTL